MTRPWLLDRPGDADDRRLVVDDVDAGARLPDGRLVAYVTLDELSAVVDLVSAPTREVVEHSYAVVRDQGVDEMRADEARTAGDEGLPARRVVVGIYRRTICHG